VHTPCGIYQQNDEEATSLRWLGYGFKDKGVDRTAPPGKIILLTRNLRGHMHRDQILKIVLERVRFAQDRIPDITRVEINEDTRPTEDIEKFDSKRWSAVRDLIAIKLGISLEGDNIFREGKSTPRTIGQIVDHLYKVLNRAVNARSAA
jgi:hypothetical protein